MKNATWVSRAFRISVIISCIIVGMVIYRRATKTDSSSQLYRDQIVRLKAIQRTMVTSDKGKELFLVDGTKCAIVWDQPIDADDLVPGRIIEIRVLEGPFAGELIRVERSGVEKP